MTKYIDSPFQKKLHEAREKYRKTGEITPEEACIYLNCKYTQQIVKETIPLLHLSKETLDQAITILKEYEKEEGVGKVRTGDQVAGAVIYIAAIQEGERRTQTEIAKTMQITVGSFIKYVKEIIQTIREKEAEGKE